MAYATAANCLWIRKLLALYAVSPSPLDLMAPIGQCLLVSAWHISSASVWSYTACCSEVGKINNFTNRLDRDYGQRYCGCFSAAGDQGKE